MSIDHSTRFNTLNTALSVLKDLGARYGDVRAVDRDQQWTQVRNDQVDGLWHNSDNGFGVRALVGNSWGYAASPLLTEANVIQCAKDAYAMAAASQQSCLRTVDRGPAIAQQGTWATPRQRDPFNDVSTEEKVAVLTELCEQMRRTEGVIVATALAHALRVRSWLVSTEGTQIHQETLHCGGGIQATARVGDEVQSRSYPKHYEGNILGGGWERWEQMGLSDQADRVASEAVMLCTAPSCPHIENATAILEASMMSLQIHESCGHPTELDRAFGEEISLAGASFLTPDRLNADYRYGSNIVNLYSDASTEGATGSFGWDDEGTPARRTDLVKDGIFTGYLSGREASTRAQTANAGSFRAEGWYNIPIVRMINVNLAPGQWSFDDLIADTEDGILLSNSKSWSIDDLRLNFQFGCELAQEIKGGKRGQIYKNPVYTGITPRFWQSCDAICNQDHWEVFGYLHCGKGDPIQSMHVGHGTAPARFAGGVTVRST